MIIYFKWLSFLVINLVTNLMSFPLTFFVVPFASKVAWAPSWLFAETDGWLPIWLWWFQTPDNSLDGDSGWRLKHKPHRYWSRVFWLWRNRLYGFSHSVLRVIYDPANGDYGNTIGNPNIGNNGRLAQSGWYYKRLYCCRRKLKGFEFYFIKQWPFLKNKCIRILIGWKLPDAEDNGKYTICTFGFSVNFFQHFGL